jgi:hypothetical protein
VKQKTGRDLLHCKASQVVFSHPIYNTRRSTILKYESSVHGESHVKVRLLRSLAPPPPLLSQPPLSVALSLSHSHPLFHSLTLTHSEPHTTAHNPTHNERTAQSRCRNE